jgi:hypothetical protein
VILGCAEIVLVVGPEHLSLPIFDSRLLHADQALRFSREARLPEMPNRITSLNAAMAWAAISLPDRSFRRVEISRHARLPLEPRKSRNCASKSLK